MGSAAATRTGTGTGHHVRTADNASTGGRFRTADSASAGTAPEPLQLPKLSPVPAAGASARGSGKLCSPLRWSSGEVPPRSAPLRPLPAGSSRSPALPQPKRAFPGAAQRFQPEKEAGRVGAPGGWGLPERTPVAFGRVCGLVPPRALLISLERMGGSGAWSRREDLGPRGRLGGARAVPQPL